MNDEQTPPRGGAVERDVGRALHWTDTASRDELEDYCRHAEEHQRAQAAELDRLRAERDALAERIAAALESRAEWVPCDCGCPGGEKPKNAVAVTWLRAASIARETPNAEVTGCGPGADE